MRQVLATSLLALALVGCTGSDDPPPVFTLSDSGSTVEVSTGRSFEILLESNASTGYTWQVTSLPVGITLTGESFVAPTTDLVGAPGAQSFTFEAVARDAGILRFEYVRPFDEPIVPDRVSEFVVRVDDAPWPPVDVGDPPQTTSVSAPTATSVSPTLPQTTAPVETPPSG